MDRLNILSSQLKIVRKRLDTLRLQREKLRNQVNILTSRVDYLRRDRDNQKSTLNKCRNQLSFTRKQSESFSDETSLVLDLFCRSLPSLFQNTNNLAELVDLARLSCKNKRFAKLKDALRNECSSIIDNSSDLKIVDSAKLVLGIINYYSGLDKGSLTYFESIQDKSILQKFAFVEYFNTILKYADTLQPPRSPFDLIKSVDEAYLGNESNMYGLIAGINSCRSMSVPDRILHSQHILDKQLCEFSDNSLVWMSDFLTDSKMSLESSHQSQQDDDVLNIGIMDYKMIDINFCSGNLGDYVQTMASALAWNQALGLTYDATTEIGSSLNSVLESAKPVDIVSSSKLNPVVIDRDSSFYKNNYPDNTWFVCNGWYHHSAFATDLEFGFPENVNPIFVSFHLNKSSQLRPEIINYLKMHQPIGCRDWTTVYMLASKGVKAFFSGCLTMTIGDLYHSVERSPDNQKIACVEAAADPNDPKTNVVDFVQVGTDVKELSISDGIPDSYNMLKNYLDFEKIYTSRLHCYLPCTSMGLRVSFKPKNESDQRYPGLHPLTAEEFSSVRAKLRNNLTSAIRFIDRSKPTKHEFLAYWTSLWSDEVKQAELRYQSGKNVSLSQVDIDINSSLNELHNKCISSSSEVRPNDVQIAFGFDSNLLEQFEVTTKSLLCNTSSTMSFYILGRNLPDEWISSMISRYPQINFNFYDMSIIDYGEKVRTLSHITESTMDRVFLSSLLHLDKILYLDTDLIVRTDIGELWHTDIGDNMIGGVQSIFDGWKDIMSIILRASKRLDSESAENLRRYCYSKFPDSLGSNFNAGVLIMNLQKMRSISFTEEALPFIIHYGLNDQDVLSLIANGQVFKLARDFNVVPTQSYGVDPKIVHWAGPRKPWLNDIYTPYKKEYYHYKNMVL